MNEYKYKITLVKGFIKIVLRKTRLYYILQNLYSDRRQIREERDWACKGKPMPPPHRIKQNALREYTQRYNLKIFVETGTYHGDMIQAMKSLFQNIYSIELSRELYERARDRFKYDNRIELIHGDSSKQLCSLMSKIDKPTLFWLDGHYSGSGTVKSDKDTPILEELDQIFMHKDLGHVIIIDDARLFGKDPAYPQIEKLKAHIFTQRPNVHIVVENDSIIITPSDNDPKL